MIEGIAATLEPTQMVFTNRRSDATGFGVLTITNADPTNFAATTSYTRVGLGSAQDYFDVNEGVAAVVTNDGKYAFVAGRNGRLFGSGIESIDGLFAGSNVGVIQDNVKEVNLYVSVFPKGQGLYLSSSLLVEKKSDNFSPFNTLFDKNIAITDNSISEISSVSPTEITEVRPFEISIFKSGANSVSIGHTSPFQISTNEPSQTQFGIAEISPTQISPTQIGSQQIRSTQVSPAQVSPTQVSLFQINPTKVSLSNSIPLEQLLSIHNSTPTSVNSYKDNPLNLWQTLLDPTFNIDLEITDLPAGQLAEAVITSFDPSGRPNGGTLLLDHNANGIGWYIDPTPLDHSKFTTLLTDTAFRATTNSPAAGRYDLLTTLLHEMGHLSGFISGYSAFDSHIQTLNSSPLFLSDNISATLTPDGSHLDPKLYPHDLMNLTLTPGDRKLPSLIDLQILNAVRHSTATASLLATLNILSLLFHTLLELLDQKYKLLRSHLPTRKTFFDDLRGLTRYLYFDSWDHLLTFMLEGLELQLPPNTS